VALKKSAMFDVISSSTTSTMSISSVNSESNAHHRKQSGCCWTSLGRSKAKLGMGCFGEATKKKLTTWNIGKAVNGTLGVLNSVLSNAEVMTCDLKTT
jgi:hypothetical protein